METLSLGYSPCPNDTFIFTPWVENRIEGAALVKERLEDIASINRLAMDRKLDISKVSFPAF